MTKELEQRLSEAGIDPHFIQRLRSIGGPNLVEQLIGMFRTRGPELVQTIEQGLADGNLESAKSAAHSLISSAGNLGGTRVSQMASAIEQAAVKGDAQEIGNTLDSFKATFQAFNEYLDSMLEKS